MTVKMRMDRQKKNVNLPNLKESDVVIMKVITLLVTKI